ncbi:MAG: DinB family protein [Gemmatimonadales bacterium]
MTPATTFDFAGIKLQLTATPGILRHWLAGLPSRMLLLRTEGPDSWSPIEIVGHLIHGERTDWIARVRHILECRTEPFPPFDRLGMLDDEPRPIEDMLDEFATIRNSNLQKLDAFSIGSEQLSMTGQHPELGEVSLGQLLSAWATHDLNHIAQIARVLAKNNLVAIGPWRAYLPIVDR